MDGRKIVFVVLPMAIAFWAPARSLPSAPPAPASDATSPTSESADEAEAEIQHRLSGKVAIETKGDARVGELLRSLSFITGVNFVVTKGAASAAITGKFNDLPVRDILDAVCPTTGLQWSTKGNVIVVVPNLKTKAFPIDHDTLVRVDALWEEKELQQLLWSAAEPPVEGIKFHIDRENSVVVLMDTPENIVRMDAFLESLAKSPPPRLVTRIYPVRPDVAERVKGLVEAAVLVKKGAPQDPGRRVLLAEDGDKAFLIVRDTERNLRDLEAIVGDPEFLDHIERDDIEIYTTNLTPLKMGNITPKMAEDFGRDIKEIVESMLYHRQGVEEARKKGRRMWYDPPTLQLTFTDYPSNIRKVAEFLDALPWLGPDRQAKITALPEEDKVDLSAAAREGFVEQWWVAGPLSNEDVGLFAQALPPEKAVNLETGFNVEGRIFRWTQATVDPHGVVNTGKVLKRNGPAGAYLYAEIKVDKATFAQMLVGSENGFVAWVNGRRIGGAKAGRDSRPAAYRLVAWLKPGTNKILLKVFDDEGDWKSSLQLISPHGKPLRFEARGK